MSRTIRRSSLHKMRAPYGYNAAVSDIYLIRHGQTAWNGESRRQGHCDIPLDEVGLKQSRLVAARFPVFDALYSSDLQRALDTARCIGEPIPVPELRELNVGDWEGTVVGDTDTEELTRFHNDPLAFTPPNGENIGAMADRAFAAFQQIAEVHKSGTVIIVTHGGPIKTIGLRLLAGTSQTFPRLRTDNTGVSLVRDGVVMFWNDTAHLGSNQPVTDAFLRGGIEAS